MLFIALSDQGVYTQPISAISLADAANQLKQIYGLGTGTVNIAVLLPDAIGTITQNPTDPSQATITQTGDGATQAQINNAASAALANNTAYLALTNPTTAQAVAQVRALTQQVDALIRLAVGNFSGTT